MSAYPGTVDAPEMTAWRGSDRKTPEIFGADGRPHPLGHCCATRKTVCYDGSCFSAQIVIHCFDYFEE